MKIGRPLLRLSVGGFFIGHGTQKLFGWFGGHGLEATAGAFEQMGLRPASATRSCVVWRGGGGAAARCWRLGPRDAAGGRGADGHDADRDPQGARQERGPWATNGGYEYNVVLIGADA